MCIILAVSSVASIVAGIHPQPRIVGGLTSVRTQFPYYVFMKLMNETLGIQHYCGATLLNDKFVLTAGHCIVPSEDVRFAELHFGVWRVKNIAEKGRFKRLVPSENFFIHPNFSGVPLFNDIALIKLDRPIEYFSPTVEPVKLPTRCISYKNLDIIAIGCGYTDETEKLAKKLQWTWLRTIPRSECESLYSVVGNRPSIFCAKGINKRSINVGDSGSAVIEKANNTLVAVVSFVHKNGALLGHAQGFTKVLWHSHAKWISNVTGLNLPACR